MRSPQILVPANAENVSPLTSSARLIVDVLGSGTADVATKQRGLQLRRFSVVDSSTSEQSSVSHELSRSPSSAASAPRRRRGDKHRLPEELLTHAPADFTGTEIPSPHCSTAGEDAAALSPEKLDDAKGTGDSSRLLLPQSHSHVALVSRPSVGSLAPTAVVATVTESPPPSVMLQPLPHPETHKHSARRHSAAAVCQASTPRPKESRLAPAAAEVQQPQSKRQLEDGNLKGPLPSRSYTSVPQWTRHMKKRDGLYVTRARMTNPTALYDRGIKELQRISAKREAMRAKLEEAELAEATFHPSISPRVSALKRSGDIAGVDRDSSAQLRYRLHLLELPDGLADASHRYTPRLSHTSEMIVRACRERGGAELPPEERLYRDYFYRQQTIDEARLVTPPPTVVRSKRDIDVHIAELYAFEQQRQHAITAAREALLSASAGVHPRVYVDPRALVERLTKNRSLSQRRTAAAQLEKDQWPFQPQTSANARMLAHQARLRGLHRWVRYFCGSDILSLPVLSTFQGQAAHEAARLYALLWQHSPAKTEWSAKELAEAFLDGVKDNPFVAELWRRRPPVGEASVTLSELTYRPCLNPKSAIIVEKMEAEHRCGPAHDRLFLDARAKQLSQRQQELEEEQAALESKQREQQRRQRRQAAWHAQEAHRLEVYLAEKAKESCKNATAEATAAHERPHPRTATSSRRLFPSSSSPQRHRGDSASKLSSSSPRPSPVTETNTVILVPRSPTPSMLGTPSAPPSEVARMRSNKTGGPTKATNSSGHSSASHPRYPSPLFQPTTTSVQAVPSPPPSASNILLSVETWPEAEKHKLDRAAEALRDLLTDPTRPCGASQQASAASSQRSPPAATRIPPCDMKLPHNSRDKLPARTIDVVLECARLRDPRTLPSGERERLDRAQKRQLRELGRLLYSRYKSNIYSTNSA
ncbi:hypothetical protein MNV84_03724 [Leishmania braziliensis]|nr:hypothetical protein MNV84_03724 [Leishmania braziliensis]CAJ2473163.1 unnamed protein product [Leishmania braziliensis]